MSGFLGWRPRPTKLNPWSLWKVTSKPNPIDVHVGSRVRLRRTLLGMSQEKLGDALGLTFQQVQKYERGANRIGSSRLYKLSQILDVPVSFFFDDMPDDIKKKTHLYHYGDDWDSGPFDFVEGEFCGFAVPQQRYVLFE